MPRIAQNFADLLLLQLVRRFARAAGELDVMGDKRVPGIAREQNNFCAASFACGDKIFSAQIIPAIRLGSLLKAIVRINDPRNPRVAVLLGIE